jgi:hypothetical protein
MEHIVLASPGGVLQLGFDPGLTIVSRKGSDLIFSLEEGGSVTVANFFASGDAGLPALLLPDGSVIAGADFFTAHNIDINTAAGPAPRPPSGGTHYEDDPGELLKGVDRLEALAPSPRDGENPRSSLADSGDEEGDVFLFAALDEKTPPDIVEDFTLHEDILRFEGLIDGRDAEILMDQLRTSLGAEDGDPGKLSVDEVSREGLSLSIDGHTVEVRFEEGGRLSEEQVIALQSDDLQAQLEVLKLLFVTGG